MNYYIYHCISPTTLILQERHEVLFQDGSALGLHQVMQHGLVSHYLRVLVTPGMHAIMFDLRDLASELGAELPRCLMRDVPGLVAITLRHKYCSAAELSAAVFGVSRLVVLLPEQRQASAGHTAAPPPAAVLPWPRRTGSRAWA